jgi:hypothetical protein
MALDFSFNAFIVTVCLCMDEILRDMPSAIYSHMLIDDESATRRYTIVMLDHVNRCISPYTVVYDRACFTWVSIFYGGGGTLVDICSLLRSMWWWYRYFIKDYLTMVSITFSGLSRGGTCSFFKIT